MGHKSITVALFFGMLALPLACGGDDDDVGTSGGKGGKASGGKGGSAGKAAGGKGGSGGVKPTGGKGGGAGTGTGGTNAGTGGTTGGTGGTNAGTGGTNAGTGGTNAGTGGTNAGTGGSAGDQGGAGQGGAGEGGGGTGGETPEQHRQALCDHICNAEINESGAAGAGGVGAPTTCGYEAACATSLCDTDGMDTVCIAATTAFLECADAADTAHLYCGPSGVAVDYVGYLDCNPEFYSWVACL